MISSQFREQVETFIADHGFKPTEFGRQAVGDPSFVLGLRRGRSPTLATADKVLSFMAGFEATERKRNARRKSA
jgi:predicted transcriptional regulator